MTSLSCPGCGAALASAFPGAHVVCKGCGHRFDVPRSRAPVPSSAHADGGGPYRAAETAREPELSTTCPFCGNECPAMVRICPHCDVRLENVRCQGCFSLQAPGTYWAYNDVRINHLSLALLHLFRRPLPEIFMESVHAPIGGSPSDRKSVV